MELYLSYTIILLFLVAGTGSVSTGNESTMCIDGYSSLESDLLHGDQGNQNLIRLEETFFPTNRQNSIVVDVSYCFPTENSTEPDQVESHSCNFIEGNVTCSTYRWVASPINLYIRPELLKYLSLFTFQVEMVHTDLCIDSPLCEFEPLRIPKDNPVLLNPMEICNKTSENKNGPIHLLNNLTTNLRSYALHGNPISSSGFGANIANEKGYSAYFFYPPNPSDYCVVDYVLKYYYQRLYLHLAEGLLMFFLTVAIPWILLTLYDTLRYKLVKSDSIKYFVWASVLTAAILDILIVICDVMTVVHLGLKTPSSFGDVWIYFIAALCMLVLVALGDILILQCGFCYLSRQKQQPRPLPESERQSPQQPDLLQTQSLLYTVLILKELQKQTNKLEGAHQALRDLEAADPQQLQHIDLEQQLQTQIEQRRHEDDQMNIEREQPQITSFRSPIQDFPIPTLIQMFSIIGVIPWPSLNSTYWIQFFGAFFVVFFLQLLPFHSIYILFGVIASPVETSSLTVFYASFTFCFIAFMAILLKSTDNSDCRPERNGGGNDADDGTKLLLYRGLSRCSKCCRLCFLPIFLSFFFITFAVCFILFFYGYTLLVQEYRSSGGVLSFVGVFLPSSLTTTGGVIGTKILSCMSNKRANEMDAAVEQSQAIAKSAEQTTSGSANDDPDADEQSKLLK